MARTADFVQGTTDHRPIGYLEPHNRAGWPLFAQPDPRRTGVEVHSDEERHAISARKTAHRYDWKTNSFHEEPVANWSYHEYHDDDRRPLRGTVG